MLIYVGIFFIIPGKIRSRLLSQQHITVTASIGILGACLGLYGIYRSTRTQVSEKFAGIGEECGPSRIICGKGGYELRTGSTTNPSSDGETSWLITNFATCRSSVGEPVPCTFSDPPTAKTYIMNCVQPCTQYDTLELAQNACAITPSCRGITLSGKTYCSVNQKTLPSPDPISRITPDLTVPFNIKGRYIRVRPAETSGDGTFHLSQIVVLDANGNNIAKGKSIGVSGASSSPTKSATLLVDGTLTLPRLPLNGWTSNGNRSTYVQIDLGSVQLVSSVRIIGISRLDASDNLITPSGVDIDRYTGMRISILNNTGVLETLGTCTLPPAPTSVPANATSEEMDIISPLIIDGYDGQIALNVLKGLKLNKNQLLTTYGLTDSQAADAYNKLYSENLLVERTGVTFSASWANHSSTLNFLSGEKPAVNMTVKTANGIPVNAKVLTVTGNTITLNTITTSAATGNSVVMNGTAYFNGTLDDTAYFAKLEPLKRMLTVASITYNKENTLDTYMKRHITTSKTSSKDSAGKPVLDATGSPVFTTSSDLGEKITTKTIMGVTKATAVDPNAINSTVTKATTTSPEGQTGYIISTNPDTKDWSSKSLELLPQQKADVTIGNTPPIEINPTTTDAEIAVKAAANTSKIIVSPLSKELMDGSASNTMNSFNYKSQSQNESGVAGKYNTKEVFWLGWAMGYSFGTKAAAKEACINAGADGLATLAQVTEAQTKGAQWCAYGWLDDSENKVHPMQESKALCGSRVGLINEGTRSTAGANCYGYKPSANDGHVTTLPTNAVTQTNISINKKGRYVRLRPSKTGNGWMHFSQIVVKNEEGNVISKGKNTYATSNLDRSPSASVVVDGSMNPRAWAWEGGGLWHTGKQIVVNSKDPKNPNYDEEYFEIDLGSVQFISTIDYYGRPECCYETILGTRIEVSKTMRPKPFTDKTGLRAWNQSSVLDSSKCIKTGKGVQTEVRICDGQQICMDPALTECDEDQCGGRAGMTIDPKTKACYTAPKSVSVAERKRNGWCKGTSMGFNKNIKLIRPAHETMGKCGWCNDKLNTANGYTSPSDEAMSKQLYNCQEDFYYPPAPLPLAEQEIEDAEVDARAADLARPCILPVIIAGLPCWKGPPIARAETMTEVVAKIDLAYNAMTVAQKQTQIKSSVNKNTFFTASSAQRAHLLRMQLYKDLVYSLTADEMAAAGIENTRLAAENARVDKYYMSRTPQERAISKSLHRH